MGFSHLTSHLLLFIATLLISTGMVVILKGSFDATGDAVLRQQDFLSKQFETDITIESVAWDNTSDSERNQTIVYVRNVGISILDPGKVYAYLDSIWVPSNQNNMTAFVLPYEDTLNPGFWDRNEILEIHIYGNLNSSIIHTVKITTEYGVSDSELFQ